MKHVAKRIFVLGVTVLAVVMGGAAGPVRLAAQGVEPLSEHPYGKAWEERRPSVYAKQGAGGEGEAEAAPMVLAPSAFANEHRMAFESHRDGQYEIYAADGDGNGAVRLTTSGSSHFPKLRYGGIIAAFTYSEGNTTYLRSTRTDSISPNQLSPLQGFGDVAWSSDGTRLAYARRTNATDVYIAAYDVVTNLIRNEICLTCGSGRNTFEPTWSPDDKQIVFVKANATEPKGALWRMNTDGAGQQSLTAELWWIADLRWSPDGTQVAFDYAPSRTARQRLGVLTLATGSIREVYSPNQDRVDAWMGSWSPDSQMLFFTRVELVERGGQLVINKSWIERMNADGSGRVRLPGNSGLDAMPSLQRRDLVAPVSSVRQLPPLWKLQRDLKYDDLLIDVQDAGGSGVLYPNGPNFPVPGYGYEMQMRQGLTGTWNTVIPFNPQDSNTSIFVDRGPTYYFRSRAKDLEGNVENWPTQPDYDALTAFYKRSVAGKVSDNRGVPLAGVPVTATQAVNVKCAPKIGQLAKREKR